MKRLSLFVLIAFCIGAVSSHAETPEEKGRRIAQEARDHGRGFHSAIATGELVLQDRSGNRSVRGFVAKGIEVGDDENRSLVVFEQPRTIAGLALLTYVNKDREDDQWLYLPSIKRVKRISSAGKTSSFAGSEFAYEDMIGASLDDYDYKWLRDESCPDLEESTCHVIERYPHDADSGYHRQVVWMEQNNYLVLRVDFYDRKDELLKSLVSHGYKIYEGRFWRPDSATMTNHRTGKKSTLKWTEHQLEAGLTESDFSRRALERLN